MRARERERKREGDREIERYIDNQCVLRFYALTKSIRKKGVEGDGPPHDVK